MLGAQGGRGPRPGAASPREGLRQHEAPEE